MRPAVGCWAAAGALRTPRPVRGGPTEAILRGVGYDGRTIEQFKGEGVV